MRTDSAVQGQDLAPGTHGGNVAEDRVTVANGAVLAFVAGLVLTVFTFAFAWISIYSWLGGFGTHPAKGILFISVFPVILVGVLGLFVTNLIRPFSSIRETHYIVRVLWFTGAFCLGPGVLWLWMFFAGMSGFN